MSTPTKESIIGTYINGRNAQDDFLQLATNHGGTVFGWIDAAGHLQGSLIQGTGTPGGANTDVQFNSAGILGGDAGFTYDPISRTVTVAGLTPQTKPLFIVNNNSALIPACPISIGGAGLPIGSLGTVSVSEIIQGHNNVNCSLIFVNEFAPGNTGSSRATYTTITAGDDGAFGVGVVLQDLTSPYPAFNMNADGSFELGTNNTDGSFTEIKTTATGHIQFYINSNANNDFPIDMTRTAMTLQNLGAATIILNQDSPALVFTGQLWDGISSSKTNSYTIQAVNGALLFTTVQNVPVVQSYVFNGNVELLSSLTSLGGAALVFATGSSGTVYPVTSVANAVGNLTTYNYTAASGGQPQGPQNVTIAGFSTGANNGTFVVQSATLTTLTVYNSSGVSETHVATATVQGTYVGNQGQSGFSYANGNVNSAQFPIAGTSYAIPNQFSSTPTTPSFTSIAKGDSVDAGYWRHLNDGATGNHGLEIGSIIDSTGSTPVTFQLGHFNGASSAVLNVPLTVKGAPPTGTTGQISFGGTVGFGNGSSGTAVTTTTKSTGSGPATPQTIVGYYEIDVAGTKAWVPYVQ